MNFRQYLELTESAPYYEKQPIPLTDPKELPELLGTLAKQAFPDAKVTNKYKAWSEHNTSGMLVVHTTSHALEIKYELFPKKPYQKLELEVSFSWNKKITEISPKEKTDILTIQQRLDKDSLTFLKSLREFLASLRPYRPVVQFEPVHSANTSDKYRRSRLYRTTLDAIGYDKIYHKDGIQRWEG